MPWSRSELTIQASNEFGLDLKVPSAQLLVRKRFIRVTENEVTPIGRWTRRAKTEDFSSKIILATKQDRAIDLSCRACGAGAWALGLDSRWGASAPLLLTTPNLRWYVKYPFARTVNFDICTDRTKLKLDREVGGGELILNCDIELLA